MRKTVLMVAFILSAALPVSAQETATPTPTSSPTVTAPTAQPLTALWTLAPQQTDEPGQDVLMHYTVNIDEYITALLLFAILVTLWVVFIIARFRSWL